eukprot:g1350.t1 g1350   contig10:1904744-1906997(-)
MFSNSTASNPLNLFPSTNTPQATQIKLQKLLYSTTNRAPTEIQQTLAYSIFDDGVSYMTTLDMNRAASYTFGYQNSYGQHGATVNASGGGTHGNSIANEMWELLIDGILQKYTQHSVLALIKTIHLIQHILLHGSEHCVLNGELLHRIEMALHPLRQLNTALVEQQMVEKILNNEGRASGENDIVLTAEGLGQQFASFSTKATATMLKLRGGSVDQGYPVREAASKLFGVASNQFNLQQLRIQQANNNGGNSLVPIGTSKQVGFITDEGRYRLLQQKMAKEEQELKQKRWREEQQLKATRSNLTGSSANDGFGGGYASAGGSLVVGAAHSLQDMINSAKYELEQHKRKHQQKIASLQSGYSDDPYTRAQQVAELERSSNWENDPKFLEKEKALRDALEYLEEMQRLENRQGFDEFSVGNPTPSVPATTATSNDTDDRNGSVGNVNTSNAASSMNKSGGNRNNFGMDDMRPSLVTGNFGSGGSGFLYNNLLGATMGGHAPQPPSIPPPVFSDSSDAYGMGAMGGVRGSSANTTLASEQDEEAKADRERKMNLAAGIFAGLVPEQSTSAAVNQRKPIMQTGGSSVTSSALDELIPVTRPFVTSSSTALGQPFGADIPPPPSVQPPPPPMEPPPPPMPVDTTNMNQSFQFDPNNMNKKTMAKMMMQQQQQMQEMMKMMSAMGMQTNNFSQQGGNADRNGWPS